MARVQGYDEDEVDVLVGEFESVVRRSLERACAAAAANLRPALVAASPTTAHLGPEDVAVVTQVWRDEVDGVLTPYVAELYTGSAVSVAAGMADAFPDGELAGVPLVPDAFQTAYLQTASNRLVGVGDELWEDVRNELLDGIDAGQSIPQLAARIEGVAGFDPARATRIARTEVHGAAEAGSVAQVRYVGYDGDTAVKEWVSTHDIRTRMSHSLADGQQVPLDDKFNVGGSLLDFPGDPSGPADEIINCRCTTVFDLDVPPKFRCDGALVAAPGDDPGVCVIPLGPASIDHLTHKQREKIYAALTKAKKGISPAYGGAAIHKAYVAAKASLFITDPDLADVIDERQFLAAADKVYASLPGPKSKKTFLATFDDWSQSPQGKKALPPSAQAPTPQHVIAPIPTTPTPPPQPKLISPSPPTAKFQILDDPGPSGDGYYQGNGPWGLYGSSGVLVRAIDENGVARFLLIQRGEKYIGSQKYKWQLPGGGADAYEDAYQAAAREFWEETAASKEYVESMVPLGEYVYTHPSGWKYTNIVASASHTFKPKVHGSTGDARWLTAQEIQQMLDDGDIVKELAPTLRQLVDELEDVAQDTTKVAHAPSPLPPVHDIPDPAQLQFTGQTLGSHGAQVWVDPATGDRWLFKPQDDFLIELDIAMARLQSKAVLTRPAVYKITLGGKKGSIQYMFEDSKPAFPGGSFDPEKLSAEDLVVFQMEQIFDWLVSNHDTHSGQWIRLADGRLYGVDKGQAYKFLGKDKLDWSYVPVYPLGSDKLTYSKIWKAFIEGKVDLSDPTQGAIGEYMQRLMSIPDGTLRAIVTPYLKGLQKAFGVDPKKMLALIIERKNALKKDFELFWARAVAEREKKGFKQPEPPPPPPPAPPAATAQVIDTDTPLTPEEQLMLQAMQTGVVDPASIPTKKLAPKPKPVTTPGLTPTTVIDENTEAMVWKQWLKANATKVTPAYGGAKIWKTLAKVHKFFEDAPDWPTLTHLQILKIMDEKGGYVGKPKTYESVLVDWMQTPSGKKTVGLFVPDSLKPAPPMPTAVTPTVKPVVSPLTIAIDEVGEATSKTDNLIDDTTLWGDVVYSDKYKKGDVVAYGVLNNGDTLKVEAFVNVDGKKGIYVYILQDNGKWEFDAVFTDLGKLELHYDIGIGKVGEKIWHSVPPKHAPASHIPGKVAGDAVQSIEIWNSRYKWADGDVIATASDVDIEVRLVATGTGAIRFQTRVVGNPDWNDGMLHGELSPGPPAGWNAWDWKLGPSTLAKKPKTSPITGKNEGDVVTSDEIWNGTATANPGDTVAYARTFNNDGTVRITFSPVDGTMEIRLRMDGETAWKFHDAVHGPLELKQKLGQVTWFAAKADGSMPDVLDQKKSGGKKYSKMPSTYEGDPIETWQIGYYADNFGEYEVIAEGVAGGGAWQWRIYQIQGIYVREAWFKYGNQGYEFDGIVDDLDQPLKGTVFQGPHQWYAVASGTKAHPSSVGAKDAKVAVTSKLKAAAKKAAKGTAKKAAAAKKVASPAAKVKPLKGNETHIPGKVVDDEIDNQQIMAHYDKYEDGTIVAVTKSTWGATRVVVIEGKLVLQEQTAAKAWKNKKIISNAWQLYGKWYASNEKLPKPQHNAAKKFVQKKMGTLPPPSTLSSPSSAPSGPLPTSFNMRAVDITPWNETEKREIYDHYRKMGVYTAATPEKMWEALQTTKSFFQAKYGGKYTKLNEIEILRILDETRSKVKGEPNAHWYEAKIVNWLKTPQARFYVNRRIDAPVVAREIPEPRHALDALGNPDPDKQSYKIITTSDAKKYREESHAQYGAFSGVQKAAARKYTGGSYTAWNAAIRKGNLGSYRTDIIHAQQAARPSTRPMLLHRGCSFSELNDPSITSYETLLPYVGRTYTTRGFTSTSVGGTPGFSGQLIIEIECPIGTPMTHVADFSQHPGERETTLPTHLVYKILSVTKKGHQTVMRVRVIGVAQTGGTS